MQAGTVTLNHTIDSSTIPRCRATNPAQGRGVRLTYLLTCLLTYLLTYLLAAAQVMQLLDDGTPENRWTGAEGERLAS